MRRARMKHCIVRRGIDIIGGSRVIFLCVRCSQVDGPSIARICRLGSQARVGKPRANAEHPQQQHSGCPAMQLTAVSKHIALDAVFQFRA